MAGGGNCRGPKAEFGFGHSSFVVIRNFLAN
jgi:hypothetical protein